MGGGKSALCRSVAYVWVFVFTALLLEKIAYPSKNSLPPRMFA